MKKKLHQMIAEYSDAVAQNGIASVEAKAIRDRNASNKEFLAYADSVDKLRRMLSKKRARREEQEKVEKVFS